MAEIRNYPTDFRTSPRADFQEWGGLGEGFWDTK
jgi:hypothetical protein